MGKMLDAIFGTPFGPSRIETIPLPTRDAVAAEAGAISELFRFTDSRGDLKEGVLLLSRELWYAYEGHDRPRYVGWADYVTYGGRRETLSLNVDPNGSVSANSWDSLDTDGISDAVLAIADREGLLNAGFVRRGPSAGDTYAI